MFYRYLAFLMFNPFMKRHHKLAQGIYTVVAVCWVLAVPLVFGYLMALAIVSGLDVCFGVTVSVGWLTPYLEGAAFLGWGMFTLWRLALAEHRLRRRPDYWEDEDLYWP